MFLRFIRLLSLPNFSNSGVINVIAALEKVLKGKEPRNNMN